jgi:hypothetical protein
MRRFLISFAVGLGLLFGAIAPTPASAYYYRHGYYRPYYHHHYYHRRYYHPYYHHRYYRYRY